MTQRTFVKEMQYYCQQLTGAMIYSIEKPSGREPDADCLAQSAWYTGLKEGDREMLRDIVSRSIKSAIFGFLVELDGCGGMGDSPEKGMYELRYIKGETSCLLNDRDDAYLHDLFDWDDPEADL